MASEQTGISGRGGSPEAELCLSGSVPLTELHAHMRRTHGWNMGAVAADDYDTLRAMHKCALDNMAGDRSQAYAVLCAVTAHVARGALAQGLTPDDVAQELHALADAIDGTIDVAESMYAIPPIPRAQWESIGVDFSEVE